MKWGNLPEGWELEKLEEVLELNQSGIWGEEPRKNAKSYPIIRSTEITHDCKLKVKSVAYRHVPNDKIDKYRLNMGDLLIVKSSGSPNLLGRCVIYDQPYSNEKVYLFSNFVQRFRTNRSTLPNFLYYFLNSYGRNFVEQLQTTTTGLRNLPISAYVSQLVPMPPIEEQKQIVKRLQFTDYLKERRKEAKELIDKIIMSVFYDMFGDPATNPKGWEVKRLEEVCEKITDGSHYSPKTTKEGFPYITVSDVKGGSIDFKNCKKIAEKAFADLKNSKCMPIKGDVLFSKDGTVGKVVEVKESREFVVLSSLAIIRSNNKILNSTYLKYLLKLDYCLNQAMSMKTGSAIKRIILKNIKNIKIPLPPLDLQQEVAEIVSKLEEKRKQMEEAEEKLEMLYQILLKQAFAGKLTEEWRMEGNASKSS